MASSMGGYGGLRGAAGSATGLKGTGYKQASLPNFSPEQMQLFQSLFSHLSPEGSLSKLASGDQSQFEQLEAPALKQFGQLQSGIANRFSGMGTGARKSSGFFNAQNTAAQDFASQLQSQRMGIQQQALRDLLGMSSDLLGQRTHDNFLVPKKKSFLQELLSGASGGLGEVAGAGGGSSLLKLLGLL